MLTGLPEHQPGQTKARHAAVTGGLLEALERTGHEVAYQCRSGYCGACRTRLYSGGVSYPQPPLAFVGADEVLPCCCRVDTDIHLDAHLRTDFISNLPEPDLFD